MQAERVQITGNFVKTSETGPERAKRELETFTFNIGLDELSRLYGIEDLPTDTEERLHALQKIAEEHWDYRRGAERQAVDWEGGEDSLSNPDSEQWATVFSATDKLGLVESSRPNNPNPDVLVVLGGANKAPLDRTRYALESVDSYGQIVAIGTTRPVGEAEKPNVEDYAEGAETEFDLMCGALVHELNATQDGDDIVDNRNGDEWRVRVYKYLDGEEEKTAFVLGTPHMIHRQNATENATRATTYDNYDFLARALELDKNPNTSIVSVTTAFYTAGQHLPGVQELVANYGVELETIGHDAEYSGKNRTPKQLLMETKAAIDAADRLHVKLHSEGMA